MRRFHRGIIVRSGALAWTAELQLMPAAWRVRCGMAAAVLGAVAGAVRPRRGSNPRVTRPLAQELRQATAVAAGQPGDNGHLNRVEEIGLNLRAVDQAGLNLRSLFDDVGQQVPGLQNAGSEIAAGSQDLSGRTERAAGSLQQTASSMEKMTSSVRNNADSARQESALVGRVVGTMHEIPSSSRRTGDGIAVIDGIAIQTTSWRSMQWSRPPAPALRGAATRSSPARCARRRSAVPRPPRRSAA